MKVFSTLLLVIATAQASAATGVCGNQPKSCAHLPISSAKACSSIISKSKLKIATCSKPSTTVTRTSTISPKTTKIVTKTQTLTLNKPTIVQRTVLTIATQTSVSQTTVVETRTTTDQTTLTMPETETAIETNTVTTTTTSFSNVPYQPETCQVVPSVIKRGGYNVGLPVTAPATSPRPKLKKPTATFTLTKYVAQTTVKYDTKTADVQRTSTAVDAVVSTYTSITSVGISETATATSTTTETITEEETTTAVAVETVQANPCDNPTLFTAVRPSFPIAIAGARSDSTSPQDCCDRCFGGNVGCLFWRYANRICAQYVIPNAATAFSWVTDSCRKGRPDLLPAPGDGGTYGVGKLEVDTFVVESWWHS
ncbi:hypothetical protein BU23DRAFT_569099 [Bimuria novae-zelandiae CBS 107.79]|uniref:Apple domain-containing protein n=1 Tax=Bimuria novae-zelandiae CBS 107.79 TaxID=1447943 RepID=A0A6A5V634_9PLEO|nr:hypothetical protein BU23DRAFT_569099 [Bimuria novae-zelandiae CBS 107.79]